MKPYTIRWWKEQWINAVSKHDEAIFNHDNKSAFRYGLLAEWIDQRIREFLDQSPE